MTVKEAILTLNANVVVACERARFDSATVKMIEDALDTIENALKERQWRKFEFREPDADEKESHPEWIKVLIGGPDDGDEILVSDGKYVWKDEFCVDDTCHLDSDADIEECWWMPLPEPPKEEENAD